MLIHVLGSAAGGGFPQWNCGCPNCDGHALFFDGTFWSSDEMPALGIGMRHAEDMGHLPIGGPEGSLARLAALRVPRRLYIHLNNTNPVLREDGPERAEVRRAGWEIAEDGLEMRV